MTFRLWTASYLSPCSAEGHVFVLDHALEIGTEMVHLVFAIHHRLDDLDDFLELSHHRYELALYLHLQGFDLVVEVAHALEVLLSEDELMLRCIIFVHEMIHDQGLAKISPGKVVKRYRLC